MGDISFNNLEEMLQDIKVFKKSNRMFFVTFMNSTNEGATYTDIISINIANVSDKINVELKDIRGKIVGAISFMLDNHNLYRKEFNSYTYYVFAEKK